MISTTLFKIDSEGSFVAEIQGKLGIKMDGYFSAHTANEVSKFQQENGLDADGIVGKKTLEKLGLDFSRFLINGNDSEVVWELPNRYAGYRVYNPERKGDQFGTEKTIEVLKEIGFQWNLYSPLYDVQYGDISRLGGGRFSPHSTHRQGTDVDVRPFRSDKIYLPTQWNYSEYSQKMTEKFLNIAKPYCNGIYFNDKALIAKGLCSYARGHDNHLHLKVRQ